MAGVQKRRNCLGSWKRFGPVRPPDHARCVHGWRGDHFRVPSQNNPKCRHLLLPPPPTTSEQKRGKTNLARAAPSASQHPQDRGKIRSRVGKPVLRNGNASSVRRIFFPDCSPGPARGGPRVGK
ncbi:hypothetical protein TNIN_159761, partial [Trichonephila inaurata madagascariensis]